MALISESSVPRGPHSHQRATAVLVAPPGKPLSRPIDLLTCSSSSNFIEIYPPDHLTLTVPECTLPLSTFVQSTPTNQPTMMPVRYFGRGNRSVSSVIRRSRYSTNSNGTQKSAHAVLYSDVVPAMIPIFLLGSAIYLVSLDFFHLRL